MDSTWEQLRRGREWGTIDEANVTASQPLHGQVIHAFLTCERLRIGSLRGDPLPDRFGQEVNTRVPTCPSRDSER